MTDVFRDPELFLNRFEEVPGVPLALGNTQFIRLEQDELESMAFLDKRELVKPVECRLPLDEFALQAEQAGSHHRFGLIYHSAFCCSTYLARCLDTAGAAISLKEPYALTQLAFYHADETHEQFDEAKGWDRILTASIDFLSRPSPKGRMPVIKTHNICIVLAPEIARLFAGRARSLFVYSDLRSFLASTLKAEERRQFARLLLKLLGPRTAARLDIPVFNAERLSDAEAAACCWLMHMAAYEQAARQFGGDVFRSLNCERLLGQAVDTVTSIAAFLGTETNQADVAKALELGNLRTHAKFPERAFSAEMRRTELQTQGFMYRREIKEAMRWFEDLDLREELRAAPAHPLPD